MLVIPFDPHLPKISRITQNHFNHMKRDPLSVKFFKEGVKVGCPQKAQHQKYPVQSNTTQSKENKHSRTKGMEKVQQRQM